MNSPPPSAFLVGGGDNGVRGQPMSRERGIKRVRGIKNGLKMPFFGMGGLTKE